MNRPVPTSFAVALFAVGLFPAVLSLMDPVFAGLALAIDAGVVALTLLDWALAPRAGALGVARKVEPILSAGVSNPVQLELELAHPLTPREVEGELRDTPPWDAEASGYRQSFRLTAREPRTFLTYRIVPSRRGDLAFGDVFVRLLGPLRLCARQQRIPLASPVKAYPDLTALSREALALARADDAPADRVIRRPAEGNEFESLREYRAGDDYRTLDWKATARRAKHMVRVYEPERNQAVLLLLDCGRHMAGQVAGRRKLDHAVDAALRLAKVCLDKGDAVGLVAFATDVKAYRPPRKGPEQLRALTDVLYRAEAALEESDYGRALDLPLARHHKRTLVVVLTDVQDPDTSSALVRRVLALRPRHLPLVVSLLDEDLQRAATDVPREIQDAYLRQTAQRIEDEYRLTHAQLRNAGALALRAPASRFSAAAVNEYLRVKAHGLL